MKAEEKILESISARAPVPEVLNEICDAVDCQIGSVVSLISMFASRATSTAIIARTAAWFGLHCFSSTNITNERGEELGSLEVYSCVSRGPSKSEVHLMERARQLAALAIDREAKANHRVSRRVFENRLHEWPDFMN